jgi:hypothetical protein
MNLYLPGDAREVLPGEEDGNPLDVVERTIEVSFVARTIVNLTVVGDGTLTETEALMVARRRLTLETGKIGNTAHRTDAAVNPDKQDPVVRFTLNNRPVRRLHDVGAPSTPPWSDSVEVSLGRSEVAQRWHLKRSRFPLRALELDGFDKDCDHILVVLERTREEVEDLD